MIDLDLNHRPHRPSKSDYGIGAIGAGFIMRDCHLLAYQNAGFRRVAIASRTRASADAAAALRGVERVYDDWKDLLRDPEVEIVDLGVPPDQQPEIIHWIAAHRPPQLKGILAQKPLALDYQQALGLVQACDDAGLKLGVNQNMRYDQSVRALKIVLERGYLGEPVLATIEMRAIPHWMPWQEALGWLTLRVMSIHHLDTFRYWFGDPERVFCSVRPDPRTRFPHTDGIALYILEFENGLRCSSWDDVWAGPAKEVGESDLYIKWRVEGTEGLAEGAIGWPKYPERAPSTLRFSTLKEPGRWFEPHWPEVWFPDAFEGPMAQLMNAIHTDTEPEISGRDNLRTMALVDAAYRSVEARRSVALCEITD
ncbi:MAG: Gfo/Idh/MocA family protein [Actinomycetota bacterium]